MRVLFLATNAETEASTRFRVLQFFPLLRRAGHVPELAAFFSSEPRPGGLRRACRISCGFLRRAQALASIKRYDVVVVHRELLPLAWNQLAPVVSRSVPLVYDFDDAVWTPEISGRSSRLATPETTRLLVGAARRVFAGNDYLAEYARRYNQRVDVIPTVVDVDSYRPVVRDRRQIPVVGWIGSPTTARYLDSLAPVIERLARDRRFRFRVIGAARPPVLHNVDVENCPWTLESEARAFADLDIGVYPLPDDSWSRGKCGFKAIQYMASGVAPVVSPVGVVRDIVRDGVDGFWATNPDEWMTRLRLLLDDAEVRTRFAANGRMRAVENYSVQAVGSRFIAGIEAATR